MPSGRSKKARKDWNRTEQNRKHIIFIINMLGENMHTINKNNLCHRLVGRLF
jgi:hypothetical protein